MMCQGQPVLTTTVSRIMNKLSKLLLHTMIFCRDCGQSDAFWDRYVTFLALWRPSETSQEMFNAITCIQVAEQFRSSHSYQISKLYGLSTETQTIQVPLWLMQLAIQVGSRRQNESEGSVTWWPTHASKLFLPSRKYRPVRWLRNSNRIRPNACRYRLVAPRVKEEAVFNWCKGQVAFLGWQLALPVRHPWCRFQLQTLCLTVNNDSLHHKWCYYIYIYICCVCC